MIITPRVRGYICVTAHPEGCKAHVRQQIAHIRARGTMPGPKKVLVIGASTGYGLAARIATAFGCGAATLGVLFDRPGNDTRPGTAGWYNTAAFHEFAQAEGLPALSLNGDAYADAAKQAAIEQIRASFGQVDHVVYSLASPRRTHPRTGVVHSSVLKPIGREVRLRGIDTDRETMNETTLPPATPQEIDDTVAVMGGEDWQMWITALQQAGVLADGATTMAYTYLGAEITQDVYWNGTIGAAKKDLDLHALQLRERLAPRGGDARVAVLKAVVTQASSAIPIMPLYLSLLLKAMKERGTHEGCIEQIDTLYREALGGDASWLDDAGRLRLDRKELDFEVQSRVQQLWGRVDDGNLHELTDFAGYKAEFLRLFGFGLPGVDYGAEVDPDVAIPGLVSC